MITQLFVWRYGPITGWGIYALAAGPNGERYWTREQLTEKNVRYSTDKLLFQQGKNFVESKDGVTKVIFDIENFSCNLTFKNKVPSWKPGHGYTYFTDKKDVYQYMAVISPWADVTGTITLPDRTLEVNGEGYADKARTNLFPTKINPFIIDWRTFSPPGTPEKDKWSFTILEFVMHPSFGSRRIPILLLCHDGKIVMATKHYDLELLDMAPGENTKYEYPQRLTIKAQDGDWKIEGEFKCGTLFDFTDIFAEMPTWIRKIAEKFMSRPVFFRSFGEFSGKVYMPDGAVEEIKLVGSTEYVIFK